MKWKRNVACVQKIQELFGARPGRKWDVNRLQKRRRYLQFKNIWEITDFLYCLVQKSLRCLYQSLPNSSCLALKGKSFTTLVVSIPFRLNINLVISCIVQLHLQTHTASFGSLRRFLENSALQLLRRDYLTIKYYYIYLDLDLLAGLAQC